MGRGRLLEKKILFGEESWNSKTGDSVGDEEGMVMDRDWCWGCSLFFLSLFLGLAHVEQL